MTHSWDYDRAQGEPIETATPWGAPPPQTHTPPPAKPKRNGWKIATIVLAVLATIATGAAMSGGGDANGADVPTPAPSAQTPPVSPATKPAPVTVTKTVVPAVCLDALKLADQNVEAFEFIVGWTQRYLGAAADLDVDAQVELIDELTASTESGRFSGIIPDYQAAAAACRKASQS